MVVMMFGFQRSGASSKEKQRKKKVEGFQEYDGSNRCGAKAIINTKRGLTGTYIDSFPGLIEIIQLIIFNIFSLRCFTKLMMVNGERKTDTTIEFISL
jgi:hypothetical protein